MNDAPGPGRLNQLDQPEGPLDQEVGWGSDVAARMLRRLDIPYIALNPGASYRGLHDSLVNHLGNERPEMLLCLHEEHAVAIAHGYAKATGRAMAVALHSNVGLMHGSMAVFNAWCDRQSMLILGATGPVDATLRRPWVDWLHTAQDQGALIRNFVKWDDQPGSVAAIPESIMRAWQQANTAPTGPTYVCLDAAIQEQPLDGEPGFPDLSRFEPPLPARPDGDAVRRAAGLLGAANRPVVLFGRGRRDRAAWDNRVALAERLGAAMLSDLKSGSMVPTDHPLHACPPFNKLSKAAKAALRDADVILSIGWIDLGGVLRQAFGGEAPEAAVIHAGQDIHLHNGWGKEHCALPPVDAYLLGDPDAAVADLLAVLPDGARPPSSARLEPAKDAEAAPDAPINLRDVARALSAAVGDQPVTFPCLARGWPVDLWPHRDPLAYLGKDGGGGVGSGPGLSIGAALGLRDSGRLVVGVIGDGDCLMSINALWTAARYRIPVMIVVANNRSYFNDEMHQEGVARQRGRNPANRWIGQAIDRPAPDIAKLAEAQGVEAAGPVVERVGLESALQRGIEALRSGRPFLVDIHIDAGHGREVADPMAQRLVRGH